MGRLRPFPDKGVAILRQFQLEKCPNSSNFALLTPRIHHNTVPIGILAKSLANQEGQLLGGNGMLGATLDSPMCGYVGTLVVEIRSPLETEEASLRAILSGWMSFAAS